MKPSEIRKAIRLDDDDLEAASLMLTDLYVRFSKLRRHLLKMRSRFARRHYRTSVQLAATRKNLGTTIADCERALILGALSDSNGNRESAAKNLGIGTRTLYRKLKQYGVTHSRKEQPR